MQDNFKEPIGYNKIEKLIIGSNTLLGGTHIMNADGHVPVVVGAGTTPYFWISAREHAKWVPLIVNNQSNHPAITVAVDDKQREITIRSKNTILIKARMLDDRSCLISEANLRPTGLDLISNLKELKIGGTLLSGNEFSGAKFMITVER